jgi:phenylacetate-CoA ligase
MKTNQATKPNGIVGAGFLDRLHMFLLIPRNLILRLACTSFDAFYWTYKILPPGYLEWAGRVRARAAALHAAKDVPAYASFLQLERYRQGHFPETDKDNYIRAFTTEERCVHGVLPDKNIMIDESSGSTGIPYNWIRTQNERKESQLAVSYFATYCFGKERWITINAFSMGAWATGLNMGIALQKNSIVKNTGPDIQKILHTLSFFGPQYPYLIAGYPPFLKHLLDEARNRNFPLESYRLNGLVGGEGMSEGLRDYLLQSFGKVYSGYGATDLEIGIAGETPVAVAIRRLGWKRPDIRTALFGDDSRLPMLFQYNPLMHHIEVNDNRELLFTITRRSLLSPRIRYNVHDQGGIARFDDMKEKLVSLGVDISFLPGVDSSTLLNLPFVWVFGRRDYTISVMGANIYPEDLEQCLYAEPELARATHSFCMSVSEGPLGDVQPCFLFEVNEAPDEAMSEKFKRAIPGHLRKINNDFREAWKEYPETLVPEIKLYGIGQGPFANDKSRIKQSRLFKRPEEEQVRV